MAGIVGCVGENIISEYPDLIVSMEKSIKYVDNACVDQWKDQYLAVSRVHHGKTNPEGQPVFNEDKSLLIFMDGEVYGYEADKQVLISKGHRFQYEDSDAEFCLHFYEEFGRDSFARLSGAFLLIIYNIHSKDLIIANDRFSACPLFYYVFNGQMLFGTQVKAILEYSGTPRNLDLQAVMEFFTFHRVLGTKTHYKDVKLMYPATILRFQNGSPNFKPYWEMNYSEGEEKSEGFYVEALTEALSSAVRKRTADKLRYGILLSGGLDSRTVVAAADCPMTAFTIGDFENNEVAIAKRIAESKGHRHVFIKREFDHYPNILEKAVEIGDGLFSFQHAHFLGFLDHIREECDVLQHGCALGALFQGPYLPKVDMRIFNKQISFPLLKGLSEEAIEPFILNKLVFSNWNKNPSRLFTQEYAAGYEKAIRTCLKAILEESKRHATSCYNRHDYFIFQILFKHATYLNELCIKPYLDDRRLVSDNDLFDLYLSMPPKYRFQGRILRKALRNLDPTIANIPNANTGVSPTVSKSFEWGVGVYQKILKNIRPPKVPHPSHTQGSWPRMPELIRKNEKLHQLIRDVINDDKCINPSLFDRPSLNALLNQHLNYEGDYTWIFYLVLTFGLWNRKYGPAA